MKYNYEYKRKCVELYRQGKWPETPEGVREKSFHKMIRKWVRMEEACGSEALRHKKQNKEWTAEQRYELVAQVLAGRSAKETAFSAGISDDVGLSIILDTIGSKFLFRRSPLQRTHRSVVGSALMGS